MWNLMKAQNYQARKDNFVIYVVIIGLLLMMGLALLDSPFSFEELTGSIYMVAGSFGWSIVISVLTVLLVPRMFGWDMADKTINYEVLTGHSRTKVYLARAIVSIGRNMAIIMLLLLGSIGIFTLLNGWGNNMDPAGALQRMLLLVFPVFRLSCELLLLTVLLKNCYLSMVIGWGMTGALMVMSMIYIEAAGESRGLGLSLLTIMKLLDFSNYKLEFLGGKDVAVYETALESTFVAESIGVSLLAGVVCLVIGYMVFRKRDMD